MNWLLYFFWLIIFLAGVIVTYILPEASLSLFGRFAILGIWGASLGCILGILASRSAARKHSTQMDFEAALTPVKPPETQLIPIVNGVQAPAKTETAENPVLPSVATEPSFSKEVHSATPKNTTNSQILFPLNTWHLFCRGILKNRPFHEIIGKLGRCLPEMFPNASGILYMYSDNQSELHQVLSFGKHSVGEPIIAPVECASFSRAEIVVADYSSPSLSGGCTHLHHRPVGYSFCAPIEGLEEHFGILTLQVDALPAGETPDSWKAKISIVSATFGLFVANQNLHLRFQTHSIRDTLTGLFNRRYMEESLQREVAAATRHRTPIGMIMIHPDAIEALRETRGPHAVEQMLWELAQRLPRYIRYEDIPCRYHNETLCVILPGADLDITEERAEKIRHEIENLQVTYGNTILETTLSIGVAMLPQHANNSSELIELAEQALAQATAKGRNRVCTAQVSI